MHLQFLFLALSVWLPSVTCFCRCSPDEACWPSHKEWARFNSSINGKLIETSPIAEPCYAGPESDEEACKSATESWSSAEFQLSQPLGYAYPLNESCPLPSLNNNETSAGCSLGKSPVYAVNVTKENDIVKTIKFAKERNVRLVIKSTGHDAVQRSTGYGSVSIWLRNYRGGLEFHDFNPGLKYCRASEWKGSTLTITGAYAWSDIYPIAREKGVIVIGGLNVGPCSTGGWTQGGGHGPTTRYFGMGADQVLSARVVLASGNVIMASPCENKDIFYAIRGGGGGTYGVVTQITVKTYPTASVNTIDFTMGSVGENSASKFLDAVTTVYSSLPSLSKAGFSGYGNWVLHSTREIGGTNYTNLYAQSFTILGSSKEEATKLFRPFLEEMSRHNKSGSGIDIIIAESAHRDYWSYYFSRPNNDAPVGGVSALASRLLDTSALRGDNKRLRSSLDTIGGAPGAPVYHTIVHHGLEAASGVGPDLQSAVQPGWYNSIILDIFELPMEGYDVEKNMDLFTNLRNNIVPVYRQLSPSTGTYMNEADWGDANWREDFFGHHWNRLSQVKAKYDPEGIFYCHVCVGSDAWVEDERGALCRRE
ncbi:hypothetical protein FZEAL_6646 [Fusarium zealandicum]|uniref:FAD-binding PCMH-type domain-containing protein n=1 Tax=Fusarium zealandicum TaxID=1053134 RepID=A0A8H4UHC2_9HYPO|nr:hypothetical protein FZEAL_6646 [Fusarium zealandicum]